MFHCGQRPADLSREAHAADVVAVLDALDIDRAVLVGQSMGGDTAMVAAARHPERVRGLVLVEAGPHDPEPPGGDRIVDWLNSWPAAGDRGGERSGRRARRAPGAPRGRGRSGGGLPRPPRLTCGSSDRRSR